MGAGTAPARRPDNHSFTAPRRLRMGGVLGQFAFNSRKTAGFQKPAMTGLGGLMRQVSALMLLGAAVGIIAPLGAAGRVEPIQAQNQAPPPEGFRIIGNIYWVGGEYGSYLITTPQGHILHDTGTNEMHDVIVSNVKKLGFDIKDIKMLISSHAHFDHVQGHAAMKKLTGAQVIALGGDAAALEAGQDNSAGGFRGMVAVHVDRVIEDGDTISLGGVTLRALWVPGHTQGATVWMTTVSEGDRKSTRLNSSHSQISYAV